MTVITRKVALVTGATTAIGHRLSISLAKAGWCVGVHYNESHDLARQIVDEIHALGITALDVQADLSNEASVKSMVETIASEMGGLQTVINNAAVMEFDEATNDTTDHWDAHFNLNARASLLLAQSLFNLLEDEREGNIINIVDPRFNEASHAFLSYSVSRAAQWSLTQHLALSLAPHIRVNAIAPGSALPARKQSLSDFNADWQTAPLRRKVDICDICAAMQYLLNAKSVTGQLLYVDCGRHLGRVSNQSY